MSEHEINDRAEQSASTSSNLAGSTITNPENQSAYFAARPTGNGSEGLPGLELGSQSESTSKGRTIRNGPDGQTSDGGKHDLLRSTPTPQELLPRRSNGNPNDPIEDRFIGGPRLPRS